MASSSDTRSTHIWLEDTHIALRRAKSAQANNEQITFVSALDQRNKQGYNILLFRPSATIGKRAKAVTLYGGMSLNMIAPLNNLTLESHDSIYTNLMEKVSH